MTREEQILSEAKKHYYDSINCHNAFLHGVEWADEHPANVWHDASEQPKPHFPIIYEPGDEIKIYECTALPCWGYWSEFASSFGITRWAYVSDILPKGGEL